MSVPLIPCPECDGEGQVSQPIPDRRRSAWSKRTLPPECDDEMVTCETCNGDGKVELEEDEEGDEE